MEIVAVGDFRPCPYSKGFFWFDWIEQICKDLPGHYKSVCRIYAPSSWILKFWVIGLRCVIRRKIN
jgi:hypothetical protein